MRFILWLAEDDLDSLSRIGYLQALQWAKECGFTELYCPHLVEHPRRMHFIKAYKRLDLKLVIGLPYILGDEKVKGFMNWRGAESMPQDKRQQRAVANFMDGRALSLLATQSANWASADSAFLLVGVDFFGYPDNYDIQEHHKEPYGTYWCFDPRMRNAYQARLKAEYGDIETYNAIFGTSYWDFSQCLPAKTPGEDRHGLTYTFCADAMDAFLEKAIEIMARKFSRVELHWAWDRSRTPHAYARGSVGIEARYMKVLSKFPDLDIWHWWNNAYAECDSHLDFARYARSWGGTTVVAAESLKGLTEGIASDRTSTAVRAIRDGHGGVVCRLPYECWQAIGPGTALQKKLTLASRLWEKLHGPESAPVREPAEGQAD